MDLFLHQLKQLVYLVETRIDVLLNLDTEQALKSAKQHEHLRTKLLKEINTRGRIKNLKEKEKKKRKCKN